jgi:hypothetical protein
MQHKKFLSIRRLVVIIFCALFVSTSASFVEGQSGRRVPKKPDSTDPRPPAQSEPPVAEPEPKDEKQGTPVLVVKSTNFMNGSNVTFSIVMEGFMERMRGSNAVKVRPGLKEMNRKEASDYAKASADTYVVLIQLEVDPAYSRDTDGMGYVNPNSLYVDYVMFAPGTGKSKSSGRVYQRRGAIAGMPIPGPRTGTAGAEYSLRNAGRETADRVLNALGLTLIQRN